MIGYRRGGAQRVLFVTPETEAEIERMGLDVTYPPNGGDRRPYVDLGAMPGDERRRVMDRFRRRMAVA